MSIHITSLAMTSTGTPHMARRNQDNTWTVSWLPDTPVDQSKAFTAMNLAEIAADGTSPFERGSWELAQEFAAELGFTDVREALRRADRPAVKS